MNAEIFREDGLAREIIPAARGDIRGPVQFVSEEASIVPSSSSLCRAPAPAVACAMSEWLRLFVLPATSAVVRVRDGLDHGIGTADCTSTEPASSPVAALSPNGPTLHRRRAALEFAAREPLVIGVTFAGRPAVAVFDQIRAVAKERLHKNWDLDI